MVLFGGRKFWRVTVPVCVVIAAGAIYLLLGKKRSGQSAQVDALPNVGYVADGSTFLYFKRSDFSWTQPLNADGTTAPFDLFTSPAISVEEDRLEVKAYDMLTVDDVLPLYLSAIKNKPYRIRLEGYTEAIGKNPATVFLADTETKTRAECQIGQRNGALAIYVIDFKLEERERNGVLCSVPRVRVYDEVAKKEFSLTDEEMLLEDEYMVILGDTNGNEYCLLGVGASVDIGLITCTLRYFNRKDGMAKLSLKDADGREFDRTVHLIR
jgi:hypothetical protein